MLVRSNLNKIAGKIFIGDNFISLNCSKKKSKKKRKVKETDYDSSFQCELIITKLLIQCQ